MAQNYDFCNVIYDLCNIYIKMKYRYSSGIECKDTHQVTTIDFCFKSLFQKIHEQKEKKTFSSTLIYSVRQWNFFCELRAQNICVTRTQNMYFVL